MAGHRPRLPAEILMMIIEHSALIFEDDQLWFGLSRVSRLFREMVERHLMSRGPEQALYSWLGLKQDLGSLWGDYIPRLPDGKMVSVRQSYLDCTNLTFETVRVVFDRFDPDNRYIALFKERTLRRMAELKRMKEQLEFYLNPNLEPYAWIPAAPTVKVIRYWSDGYHSKSRTLDLGAHYWSNESQSKEYMVDLGTPMMVTIDVEADGEMGRLVIGHDWRHIWTVKCAPFRDGYIYRHSAREAREMLMRRQPVGRQPGGRQPEERQTGGKQAGVSDKVERRWSRRLGDRINRLVSVKKRRSKYRG